MEKLMAPRLEVRQVSASRRVDRVARVTGLALALWGSVSWSMTLQEAVHHGLSIHPAVAAARAEVEAAATEVRIARDGYWPSLQASAGPENSLWGEFGYEITARQMLYDWGRVSSTVEGASAVEHERLETLKVTSDQAALDIIETYLDVLLYEARLVTVNRHIQRLQALAELSHERARSGYVNRGEAERAELELARAREQRAMELGALADARSQYHEVLNQLPENLALPVTPSLTQQLRDPDQLTAAVDSAPLYLRAQAEVEAAQAERGVMRAALKPQVNLEGSLLRREIGGRMEEDAVIALRLRMDLHQGLSNFRRVDAAGRREEAARWNQRATQRDLRRELSNLIEQDEIFKWRLQSLDQQNSNARVIAEAYQEQFEVGLRDIDDLLPLQRDLFEGERQQVELGNRKVRIQYQVATQLGRLGDVLNTEGAVATKDNQR